MTAKVFRCKTNQNRYGFTLDETGNNLPTQKCSKGWKFFLTIDIDNSNSLLGANPKDIIDGIIKTGYYVAEVKVNFSENINLQ